MRLVLRQQSNAFPQPWCGNPFARDRSSPGAHQKHSPAAHLHQPNPHLTRLPSKRASAVSHRVPRLPNQGRPTLRKTSCASAYQRATAGSLRPSASARTRAPSGRPGAAISRWPRRCAATPRGARLNWGHSSIRKKLYA